MKLTYGALDLTAFPYSIEFGTDVGAPQNVTEALAFLLQDGEVELSSRASNRTLTFTVLVEGASLTAVAQNEAALVLETEKPLNTISLDPEDSAPVTVFQTFRGQVTFARDDDFERARLRRFVVTVRALPFGKSAAEITAAALTASGSTTTLVNAGSATTGWTGSVSAGSLSGPTVVSGAVKVGTTAALTGSVNVISTLTASITTSSTKYLQVDWKPESTAGFPAPDLRAFGDGTALTLMAQHVSPTAGYTRSWFYVAASSIAVLRLESRSEIKPEDPGQIRSIYVDNINRTDVQPSFGSSRQSMRTVDVTGSARTPGALAVEHATNALGDVMVYTFPDGGEFNAYSPPLRQYMVGSTGVTTDATKISGAYTDIKTNTATFDIPISNLLSGLHTLVTRINSGLNETLTWTAATRVNGTLVGTTTTGSVSMVSTGGALVNRAVTQISLPTVEVADSVTNAVVRITLTTSGTGSGQLDEAWLFNNDIGDLVMVSCGTGTAAAGGPARRLFIDPPRVNRPKPTLWVGHSADRSDAYYPVGAVSSWDFPEFIPSRARVFVVTSNATEPSVTLKHTPAWLFNAAS